MVRESKIALIVVDTACRMSNCHNPKGTHMNRNEALEKIHGYTAAILKVAASLPPSDLAALAEGFKKRPRASADASSESSEKDSKSAKKGAKSKSPTKSAGTAKTAKKAVTRDRRDPKEMMAIRKGVLQALQAAEGFISASQIATIVSTALGKTVSSSDISFPLSYLRDKGYVGKKGDKINATYGVTSKGKAFDGNFEPEPKAAAPASKAKPDGKSDAKADGKTEAKVSAADGTPSAN